ncbi:MAG: hypothetical protein WCT11_02840 [Candidatus Magasanikbacteria bacterium]
MEIKKQNQEKNQDTQQKKPFLLLRGMFKWERICIYIIAVLSLFVAISNVMSKGFYSVDMLLDIFFTVFLNSVFMYFVFKLGNSIYKKIKK